MESDNFQSYLIDAKQARFLPQGVLKEIELKKINNIFDECEVETAAEIIIAVRDNCNIFSQADILERAYKYGWNKSKYPIVNNVKKNEIVFY